MITPQFEKDESNLSILKEKFSSLINQTISSDLISKIFIAYTLARFCHFEQRRDEGTPYILHPLRVSLHLMETFRFSERFFKSQNISKEDAIIIALLHDTSEDFGEKILPIIEEEFGTKILRMIQLLTKDKNLENYNAIYYDQLKKAPEIVKVIKALDRLDNLRGLLKSGKKSTSKKKGYLMESKTKILPLLDPDYSPEYHKLISNLQNVITYLEKVLSKSGMESHVHLSQ